MRLFNTQSGQIERFTPRDGKVGLYVCGVTPYDTTHIGHAFTFLTFDILVRLMRHKGWDVTYVQNVTDIDDDILRKAKEVGLDLAGAGRPRDGALPQGHARPQLDRAGPLRPRHRSHSGDAGDHRRR